MSEEKKYGIIYADPPWRYDMKRGNGVAENHYPTMSIEEICALPVADLAAKDSALFLWATFPQLNESFRVMEAWGFKYKTLAFLWLKQNRKADSWFYGMGFWTRSNAEVCLLATRGHPKRQCAGFTSLSFPILSSTARNRMWCGRKSSSLWAISRGLNCLPDSSLPAGMFGEMRWTAVSLCRTERRI